MSSETVQIGGRSYRKFIPFPEPVNDGTIRCIACGQIDEPPHHEDRRCPAMARTLEAQMPNHAELIDKLEKATELIERARRYIGNASDHPALRESPRNALVHDIDEFLSGGGNG